MGHDGNADLGECGDVWGDFLAALEFDGVDVALLDDAYGCAHGILGTGCVGAKGHVGDEQGGGCAACDGAAMMEHFVEGETGCGGVAETDLGEGVANEGDVDGVGGAGASGGEVVGCEDGDGGVCGAEVGEARDGGFLGRGGNYAHLASLVDGISDDGGHDADGKHESEMAESIRPLDNISVSRT